MTKVKSHADEMSAWLLPSGKLFQKFLKRRDTIQTPNKGGTKNDY